MQKVEVWISISGDYCAFHEMSFSIVYDITNDKKFGDLTLRDLKNKSYDGGYVDYDIVDAILLNGRYYIDLCQPW